MKALTIENGVMALRDVPVPERSGECLIRVLMAGICGTDLQLLDGYADFAGIPGHEFVGIVESAPAHDSHWIGKRVAGEINVACGACEFCATGVKEHCSHRSVAGIRGHNGAFAEYLTLPASNLHEIPAAVDDETAVFVEPVAAACRILEQLSVDTSARVAVLGDGRLGLLVAQVMRTAAQEVRVVGRHEHKLAIARSLGLAVSERPAHAHFDIVVDATGRAEGLPRALELVRPRGTIVMKSTFHGEAPTATWPIVVNEVTIVGSRCGPFRQAIEMLATGAVRVEPLVSRVAALEDYQSAFTAARRSLKVLLVPRAIRG